MTTFLLTLHIIFHLVFAFSSVSYWTTWTWRTSNYLLFLQVLIYMFEEYHFSRLINAILAILLHATSFLGIWSFLFLCWAYFPSPSYFFKLLTEVDTIPYWALTRVKALTYYCTLEPETSVSVTAEALCAPTGCATPSPFLGSGGTTSGQLCYGLAE